MALVPGLDIGVGLFLLLLLWVAGIAVVLVLLVIQNLKITIPGIALSVTVCIGVTIGLILYPREPSGDSTQTTIDDTVTDIDNLFVARLFILFFMIAALVLALIATMKLHWTQPIRARVVTKPCPVVQ